LSFNKEISIQSELCAPGHKSSKKGIAVLCCTIVNSLHKIELFLISKAENLYSFKITKAKICLMSIFRRWYGAYSLIHQGLRENQTLSQKNKQQAELR
jgi:hypothetical protein